MYPCTISGATDEHSGRQGRSEAGSSLSADTDEGTASWAPRAVTALTDAATWNARAECYAFLGNPDVITSPLKATETQQRFEVVSILTSGSGSLCDYNNHNIIACTWTDTTAPSRNLSQHTDRMQGVGYEQIFQYQLYRTRTFSIWS